MIAVDGEYEFELDWCYRQIKAWKSWYCKKNSKYRCIIQLRELWTGEFERMCDEFYLEVHREKIVRKETVVFAKEKHRIRAEAYDVLARDLPKSEYPKSMHGAKGLILVNLFTFQPAAKEMCICGKKTSKQCLNHCDKLHSPEVTKAIFEEANSRYNTLLDLLDDQL